jgi:hypothetical protein
LPAYKKEKPAFDFSPQTIKTILKQITLPGFSANEFNITSPAYGAVGDGLTDCAPAIIMQ